MKLRYFVSLFFSVLALAVYNLLNTQSSIIHMSAFVLAFLAFLGTRRANADHFILGKRRLDEREIGQIAVIDSLTINVSTSIFIVLFIAIEAYKLVYSDTSPAFFTIVNSSRSLFTIPGFTFINSLIGIAVSFRKGYH